MRISDWSSDVCSSDLGDRQTNARPDLPVSVTDGAIKEANEPRLDGYDLPQNVTPLAGGFYVGNLLHRATPTDEPFASSVTLGAGIDIAAAQMVRPWEIGRAHV